MSSIKVLSGLVSSENYLLGHFLSVFSHCLSFVCAYSVISSLYKDTSHIGL